MRVFVSCCQIVFLCCPILGVHAQDLTIEGSIDQTPEPLKKLASRAEAIENRIRELEQRISESQKKIIVTQSDKVIEYRMELANGFTQGSGRGRSLAVSHLRMSINGRPYVYTQSAVIIDSENPLPLYLGPIEAGSYLVKIQLQAAPLDSKLLNPINSPWQTIEKIIPIEIVSEGGAKQTKVLELTEQDNKIILNNLHSKGAPSSPSKLGK